MEASESSARIRLVYDVECIAFGEDPASSVATRKLSVGSKLSVPLLDSRGSEASAPCRSRLEWQGMALPHDAEDTMLN
jgi:hypothetical protein